MEFFHFSRWNLSTKDTSREFATNWDVSDYWRSRLTRGPNQATVPNSPLLSATALNEVLLHGKYAMELLKDYIFEEVRSAEFPNCPSRRQCMFLFDTELDPVAYASRLALQRNEYHLLRVRFDSDASTWLRADLNHLDCNLLEHAELAERSRAYWRGTETPALHSEVLFRGRFQIVSVS